MDSEQQKSELRQEIYAALDQLEKGRFGLRRLNDASRLLSGLLKMSRDYKAHRKFY